MQIDAKGGSRSDVIMPCFRSTGRNVFACSPAASMRRYVGAQRLPQGSAGGANRLDDRTVEGQLWCVCGSFRCCMARPMGSRQGDETMVKRTEPVKHAVTKAKDVVAKGVHM